MLVNQHSTCTKFSRICERRLETERKRVARDAELQKSCVEEAAQRGAKQKREGREQQEKIKNLERSLSRVVHEFEAERVRQSQLSREQETQQQAKNQALEQQLKAKDRELRTIRRLAKD
eukprot:SAG31_NODE_16527_length_705_cov_1.531353_1_plen_118_part_10